MRRHNSLWMAFFLLSYLLNIASAQDTKQQPLTAVIPSAQPVYKVGQAIPVTCLNRTIDTGEHIMDEAGNLQYIPFPTCNETGQPLELYFGVEKDINCTIDFISDPFFHLLEFYIHSDAPMSCRIPSHPFTTTPSDPTTPPQTQYIPLTIALTGLLQLSHLHIANNLNMLLHAAPRHSSPGTIDSAVAYSISPLSPPLKIVIGDPLPLHFSVRWYPSTNLPSGWAGVGGHLFFTTLVYCVLSAGASAAICVAYFRGVELPRRLRSYGRDRSFTNSGAGGNGAGGRYGYGVGNGYGYSGPGIGKND